MNEKNFERIKKMSFASVYPMYVKKVEAKGRSVAELNEVIHWLTGYSEKDLQNIINQESNFEQFLAGAKFNENAFKITGVICGYRVEDIENSDIQKIRYLDKLIDELAKGKTMEKILRK